MNTENNRFERMSPLQVRAVLLGLCVIFLVVLFALAEGAVRYRAWTKHGTSSFRVDNTYIFDESIDLRIPRPGYSTERMTINSSGFRSPEIDRESPTNTYRIAFLGASTTFSAEVSGDAKTWPALVVDQLNSSGAERQFDYINAGVPGYSVEHSQTRFESQVKPYRPNLVVIYHATNDLSAISRDAARSAGVFTTSGEKGFSWFSNWSMLAFLVEKNLQVLFRQNNVFNDQKLKADPESLARPFGKSLRDLVGSIKAAGADVVLVTFSTHLRRGMSADDQKAAAITSLFYMPYMTPQSLLDSFDAYNRAIREVAKDEGALLIDAANLIPGDDRHFADSVHLTDRGSAVMADIVSKTLSQLLDQGSLKSK